MVAAMTPRSWRRGTLLSHRASRFLNWRKRSTAQKLGRIGFGREREFRRAALLEIAEASGLGARYMAAIADLRNVMAIVFGFTKVHGEGPQFLKRECSRSQATFWMARSTTIGRSRFTILPSIVRLYDEDVATTATLSAGSHLASWSGLTPINLRPSIPINWKRGHTSPRR
jgi:hypothetical protein